ncbi:MAG: VWA domain-containing protein [Promethearchaeota archaeon]
MSLGVFPENPCEFSVEFIRRMRNHPDIIQIPSSRQVLSIPKLILSRFFRRGSINPQDFIDISIVTSYPDNQELAKKIAFEILFPNYNKDVIGTFFQNEQGSEEDEDFISPSQKEELDKLQSLIDEIEASKSLDIDLIEQMENFLKELEEKKNLEPIKSALNYFDNDSDLFKEQITSIEQLLEEARRRLAQKINSLEPNDLKAVKELNLNELIQEKSIRQWEKLTSKALNNTNIDADLNELLKSGKFDDLIQSMKFLKETGAISRDKIQDLINNLKDKINNLDQLFNASKNLGEVPEFDLEKVIENSLKNFNFEHNYNLANALDQFFGTNMRIPLLEKLNESMENLEMKPLSLEMLSKAALANKSWKELFDKALQKAVENAMQQGKKFEAFKSLSHQLQQLANSCSNIHCSQKIAQKIPEMIKKTLESCENPNQLKNSIEFLRNIGLQPDPKDIEQMGKKLNMLEEEIYELIEPNYRLLKKLIDKNVQDFNRLSNLMNQIKDQLNEERINDLLKSALASNNRDAMAALGHFDLEKALKGANKIGGNEGINKVIGSLQAGSGENLLKQWFIHRQNIPPKAKEKVKALAKKILIDLGIYYSRARLGSAVSGPIPINVVRPLTIGDDYDNIDLEETINNILEKGKRLEHIDYDDFFVFETAKGLRSACFELDISGSMSGEKLAYMGICITMLVYGMKKDDLAITFFESNTHVLKEMKQKIDLEELADELLSVSARGGTRLKAALDFAIRQFKENAFSREKLNVLFTDAEIYDIKEVAEDLRILRSMGVDFILVCPETQYNLKEAEKMVKIAGGQLLIISDWNNFPNLIADIIKSKF